MEELDGYPQKKNMLKQNISLIAIFLMFIGCSEMNNKYSVKLLSTSSEFMFEDGEKLDGYYEDRATFISEYKKKRKVGDTLFLETLHEINSCGNSVGDIDVVGDTIVLLNRNNSEYLCASIKFHLFKYVILCDSNKVYKIRY